MSAARDKDSADFDLERFINMFDEAMTSQDPRVVNALRQLMMMVALTAPEARPGTAVDRGPLKRLFEDVRDLNNRLNRSEHEVDKIKRSIKGPIDPYNYPYEKFSLQAAAAMASTIDQDTVDKIKAADYVYKGRGLK